MTILILLSIDVHTVSMTVRERFLNVILEHNYIGTFLKEGVKTQVSIVLSFILN